MAIMSAKTFIEKLLDICNNYKTLYVLGTWGWPAMDKNKTRAENGKAWNRTTARKAKIDAASRDTFFFDFAGLIKGILWGWCGDPNRAYGGAGYACNGVPDTSDLIGYCQNVSTDFSTIIPGELLYLSGDMGHVGVYVGDGKVIECTPKWNDSVQQTWLGNIGYKNGNYRIWEKHGKLPWIDYAMMLGEIQNPTNDKPEVDDIFLGTPVEYIVVKGDTLTKIAKKFSTTVEEIVRLNGITSPNVIFTGQKLKIKSTVNEEELVHVVKRGETLSYIAKKYNTTVVALALKNGILNPSKIVTGQVLKI